jgi:hypothetical protein
MIVQLYRRVSTPSSVTYKVVELYSIFLADLASDGVYSPLENMFFACLFSEAVLPWNGVPWISCYLEYPYPEHLFPGIFPGAPDLRVPVP